MSDAHPPSGTFSFTSTLLAVIGGFAIFLLILTVAYLPQKPAPLADGARTPEQRKVALAELRAKEHNAATTYGWVDQAKGQVRLPIADAVELTIKELNAVPKP
ncbi:hypothetical protein IMCC26134_02240 [Verrucomicrobia bacterium IMCC26134]|jgi:hypothetical protein|nr:hypothetical protein IMCC26134_02240 [Verrucomicrobia bacterium IMCC26134]